MTIINSFSSVYRYNQEKVNMKMKKFSIIFFRDLKSNT